MPTTNPHGLLFQITMRWTLHGQNCQNNFWFTNKQPQDNSPSALSSFIQQTLIYFESAMMVHIKNLVNTQVAFRALIGTTVIPKNGPIAEMVLESVTGDQPDESLPSYCAAILSLRTGFGGKSNRGRLYFGGIGENDTADGRLGPDTFTALQAIGNQLLAVFGPAGSNPFLQFVIFSRKLGTDEDGDYIPFGIRDVTQCVPRSVLGTQRHRLIGKGS